MTQTSYFWNGTTVGDASLAPYSHLVFTRQYSKIVASDASGYVAPGYLNSLNVQPSSPASASVDVASGAAIIKGIIFDNDATATLAVAANVSGNPRIDRVVIRVNFASQTASLFILQGTPAVTPTLPTLTQTYGATWEFSLAYIYVANGFSALTEPTIHDERTFLKSAFSLEGSPSRHNLVRGSDFVVPFTANDGTGVGYALVAGTWVGSNTGATISFVSRPSQQTRGFAVRTVSGASLLELRQAIEVVPSTVYNLRSLVNTAVVGAVIELYDISNSNTIITRTINRPGAWIEENIVFTTPASCTLIAIRLKGVSLQTVDWGQQVLTEGYHRGGFLPVHEYIPLTRLIAGTNFNLNNFSTGTQTINFVSGAFSSALGAFDAANDIIAVQVIVGCRDSGSAAGTPSLAIGNAEDGGLNRLTINLEGVPNDSLRYMDAKVPVRKYSGSLLTLGANLATITLSVTASGANTLDIIMSVRGVYT